MTSAARAITVAPEVPEQLLPYHSILGDDLTVRLVLELGGTPLSLSPSPRPSSHLVQIVGLDHARALEASVGKRVRVPLAKRWLAKQLAYSGKGVHEIARLMHVSDVTVRTYLRDEYAPVPQLDLFDGAQAPCGAKSHD